MKCNYKEIYSDLKNNSFEIIDFSNEFILVDKKYFEKYREYFFKPKYKNLFNSGINLRTGELFRHIHLVEYENIVQLHIDFGNLDRCFLFGIVHLVADVIPYYISFLINGKNLVKTAVEKYLNKNEKY